MKILCLHGHGSSGAIFKAQTSAILAHLTKTNPHPNTPLIFDFIDGPHRCPPGPGIDPFYKPPFYTFFDETHPENKDGTPTLETIKQANTWLRTLIKQRGPYDIVLAFSEGADVLAGFLLEDEYERQLQKQQHLAHSGTMEDGYKFDIDHGLEDPPFKSAIFICGGAPLPLLEEIGYTIPAPTKERDRVSRIELARTRKANASSMLARKGQTQGWTSSADIHTSTSTAIVSKMGSMGSMTMDMNPYLTPDPPPSPRFQNQAPLSPTPCTLQLTYQRESELRREIRGPIKICIPTVHIYGERDPRYVAGIQLSELCEREGDYRKEYNHGGGHGIPSFRAVVGAVAGLVGWGVRAAEGSGETGTRRGGRAVGFGESD